MNAQSAVLAALALCTIAHAQTPASERSPLDSAKRELQSLPQKQGAEQVLSGTRSGLGNASLPSLTDPLATSAPPSGPAQSPTWLQDTLDSVRTPRDLSVLDQARETRSKPEDNGFAAGYDPFDRYLTQWLSPRDLEILRPGSKTGVAASAPTLLQELPGKSPEPKALSADTPTANTPPLLTWEPAGAVRNPYLEALDTAMPTLAQEAVSQRDAIPGVALPTSAPAARRERAPVGPLPSATPPPASTLSPRPNAPRQETAVPPPTAPIVDDRKYFPQLRRF